MIKVVVAPGEALLGQRERACSTDLLARNEKLEVAKGMSCWKGPIVLSWTRRVRDPQCPFKSIAHRLRQISARLIYTTSGGALPESRGRKHVLDVHVCFAGHSHKSEGKKSKIDYERSKTTYFEKAQTRKHINFKYYSGTLVFETLFNKMEIGTLYARARPLFLQYLC